MLDENISSSLLDQLFLASPNFQRSINLKYDLMSEKYIDFFVPTPQSAVAFNETANACLSTQHQRAYIFVGSYGVGKSIFAVTLAALLAGQENIKPTLGKFIGKISNAYPNYSTQVIELFNQSKKFLPVVLSGDEGPLAQALTVSLIQSLRRSNLNDITIPTIYQAVLDKLEQWQINYFDVYEHLRKILEKEYRITLEQFENKIKQLDYESYSLFCKLHIRLAAGAEFDYMYNQSPVVLFEQVAQAIKLFGYSGIVIIYDEFGRFLDGLIGKPMDQEVQLLQELAEFCNRTSDPIIHFIAITHKVMTQYAQGLDDEVRIEWQRIEGRFKTLSLAGDSRISYQLLEEALRHINQFYKSNSTKFLDDNRSIIGEAVELNIVDLSPDDAFNLFENCIPLHPLTTYCLPELSNKVAQNERTLYTFLFGQDEFSLSDILRDNVNYCPLVYIDTLYDYFNESIKLDNAPGGVHDLWSFTEGVLKKLGQDKALARRVVKSLAIIHAVRKGLSHRPTDELLAFSVGVKAESKEFNNALQQLVDSKMVYFRGSTACWEFVHRSDVDIEKEIASVLSEIQPNHSTLKNFMEKELRTIYYPARKYNDEFGTIRYFTGCFYTLDELKVVKWEEELEKRNYADGLVVYVLAANQSEAEEIKIIVNNADLEQIIFVLPENYINFFEILKELYALNILKERINSLREQDPKVEQEISFLYEDCLERIKKVLNQLIEPSAGGLWYHQGRIINVKNFSGVCRHISDICNNIYYKTPVVYNEALNRREPSTQQVKAMQKLIDALFQDTLPLGLGLHGSGPEIAIYKTVLKAHGLVEEEGSITKIIKPSDENLRNVWEEIEKYIFSCTGDGNTANNLITRLQVRPFGIRKGIMPIFLSVVFSQYIHRMSLDFQGRIINPIASKHIVELVRHPEKFKVKFFDLEENDKNLLEALLFAVGSDYRALWQTKQPLCVVSKLLNDWLILLPGFAKTTTKHISNKAVLFRQAIKDSSQDPFRELLVNMPSLLDQVKDMKGYLEIVEKYMDELRFATSKLLNFLKNEFKKVFGNENIEPNLLANTWWGNLSKDYNLDYDNYNGIDAYSNILIKYCKNIEINEENWVKGLAHEYTGLELEYWSDATVESFLNMLSATKERIVREIGEFESSPSSDIITVSFGSKDDPKSFTYRKSNLTPSGMKLLNNIKRTIENTGKYLTQDERLELCTELFKYLVHQG